MYLLIFLVINVVTYIQGGIRTYVNGWNNGQGVDSFGTHGKTILTFNHTRYNFDHSVIKTYDGKLLSCGGNHTNFCYELKGYWLWVYHSSLNKFRPNAVCIAMPNGIYLFEGKYHPFTSEFLPIGENVWKNGPKIPVLYSKSSIFKPVKLLRQLFRNLQQKCFSMACYSTGHKLSENELIIIKVDQVFKFDIRKNEWSILHELKIPRKYYSSFIFKGKLFITGGYKMHGFFRKALPYTEVLDLSTLKSTILGNLNTARFFHGMSVMRINNELRLVVLGGQTRLKQDERYLLDSIEVWNEDTMSWDNTDIELPYNNSRFATTPIF